MVLASSGDVRRGTVRHPGFIQQSNPLGCLTSRYWSPSVLWTIDLVVVLTGLGFVTAAVNAAIRILFAMERERVLPGLLARLSRRSLRLSVVLVYSP
jgi:amino acid transporter